jgi:O-antigen/teichoic acid export membrane protein
MMLESKPSILRPALLLFFGRTFAFVIMFFVPVIFARILSPEEFGTYKQLFLIHATIYGIGLGLAESLFYFVPQERKHAGKYVANAVILLAAVGLVGWPALVAASQSAARWFHNPALLHLTPLIGCYLALTLASAPLEIVMISLRRDRWASMTYAVSDFARGTLMLVPILIWRSLDVLLIGSIAFAVLRLVNGLMYFVREFRKELWPDIACLKRQLLYSVPLQMAVALQILQGNFHQYVVSLRFDAASFASYAVGCLHIPLFDVMAGSVCNIMMVQMGERLKEGRSDAILEIWSDTTQKLALVFLPAVALLFVLSNDLVSFVFTNAYASSTSLFRIWMFSFLLAGLLPHAVLRVYSDTRTLALCNLAKLIVVALLIYPSISVFGLAGAVLTSVLAILVGKCMLLVRLRQLTGATLANVLPWRCLIAVAALSLLSVIPAVAIGHWPGQSIPVRIVATATAYSVTYVVGAFAWIWRTQKRADYLLPTPEAFLRSL